MKNLFKFKPYRENSGFKMDGYYIWCASVIKGDDGLYHMFASRFTDKTNMHPGWLINSEIVRATSKDPLGPYEFKEVVLQRRGAQFWDGQMTHNPHIKKIGDKYVLFYTGVTYPFDPIEDRKIELKDPMVIVARSNKRVGVAIADSLEGPWERYDEPILKTRPNKIDSFLTTNPAPIIDDEIKLIYKCRKYEGNVCSKMYFAYASGDDVFNLHRERKNQVFENLSTQLEDPFIWKDGCYKMIAKDMDGSICGEIGAGIYATSSDCKNWEINWEIKAYSKSIICENGETINLGNFERPFLLFEDGKPKYLFGAVSDGKNGIMDCTWTKNIAFEIEEEN